MSNPTKSFVVLRNLSLNGNLVECNRYFRSFPSRREAEAYAEQLSDKVSCVIALKGVLVTFFTREETVEEA